LLDDLGSVGLEPEVVVVAGVGARAGFADEAYREVGATVVPLADTPGLDAFDVVHALKEPTEYEAELRGPFLRLGALHLASRPSGVCRMCAQRNFSAILDGGTVGNASYRVTGSDRTPIVGSMSRFAGTVAGRKVVEGLADRGVGPGRVVVVGGGIAGRSAIRQVRSVTKTLVVVEPWEPMRRRLEGFLPTLGFEAFEIVPELTDDTLDGAVGVVFAHRTGAQAAEKVCHHEQILRMTKGAAISDIAIDQGGAIAHPDYDPDDDAHVAREKYMALYDHDYAYYAEVNMPREEPREASESHGDAALPYVTALLALCAHEGAADAATTRLLTHDAKIVGHDEPVDADLFDAMIQDLRNGLQLAVVEGSVRITDADVDNDASLSAWVRDCSA
ncbi:MAG: hypothetical protein AAGE94_01275, partial [Acidobacteriota bacterium]